MNTVARYQRLCNCRYYHWPNWGRKELVDCGDRNARPDGDAAKSLAQKRSHLKGARIAGSLHMTIQTGGAD